jgi:hypothetical protein
LGAEALWAVPNGSSGSGVAEDGVNVSFILLCPSDLSVWQTLGERFFPNSPYPRREVPPFFGSSIF